MPSSNTPKAELRGMRANDSGAPNWLFKLPAVAWVGACAPKVSRNISLVPVLPTDPVTATILALVRARAAWPKHSSPITVLLTCNNGPGAMVGKC